MIPGYHVSHLAREDERRIITNFVAFVETQTDYKPFIAQTKQYAEAYLKRDRGRDR